MHIDDLKQYLRINRKRLGPQPEDCSAPEPMEKLEADLNLIRENDKRVPELIKRIKDDRPRHFEHPIWFMLLTCLPSLIYLGKIALEHGWQPMDSLRMPDIQIAWDLGAVFVLQFCVTLFLLWTQWNFISTIIRLLIVIACGLLGPVFGVTLFGSETTWVAVMILLFFLETLLFRLKSGAEVKSSKKNCRKLMREMDEADQAMEDAVQRFVRLGDLREAEQSAKFPNYPLPARSSWFDFYRTYDEKHGGVVIEPQIRNVKTDFGQPFNEETRFKKWGPEGGGGYDTSKYTIIEQEFGYSDVSSQMVRELINSQEIVPFFNWGMPFIVDGLQYSIFRHKWDMFEEMEHVYFYKEKETVASEAQREFDARCMMEELGEFGNTIDEYTWWNGSSELQEARDKYLKRRNECRESLGSIEVTHDRVSHSKEQKRHRGDEIGILTVRAPDGELLGVYCGDSLQSILFTYRTIRKETGFEFSPMLHANGAAQRAFLFQRYAR